MNQTQKTEETEGLPPLHQAARFGDIAEMERLIAAGADINARCSWTAIDRGDGLTPLMVAAISLDGANAATVAWLRENGTDVHAVSEERRDHYVRDIQKAEEAVALLRSVV